MPGRPSSQDRQQTTKVGVSPKLPREFKAPGQGGKAKHRPAYTKIGERPK